MHRWNVFVLLACLLTPLPALAGEDQAADEDEKDVVHSGSASRTQCTLAYSVKGWSAFYKTSKGGGTITCDNGETAEVKIRIKGGGITFGKSEIVDGKGKFTPVVSIDDLMGAYAQAGAHAGATKSVETGVISKGEISLTMSGKGSGFDVGVDFGKFVIERV